MVPTAGIERLAASRASRFALHVLMYGQLRAAGAAKYCSLMELALRPDLDRVPRERVVAILAGVVRAAALHLDRDDVGWTVIVLAACLRIEIDATRAWKIPSHWAPGRTDYRIRPATRAPFKCKMIAPGAKLRAAALQSIGTLKSVLDMYDAHLLVGIARWRDLTRP
jgi:hypothetical protein